MARPYKNNLDSIILDLNFDIQKEIKYIEATYGLIGFAVVAKLLIYILRQSYYITWTQETLTDFKIYINANEELIESIIDSSINVGIFDSELFEAHKVLTSKKLQEAFFKACERRKSVQICTEYMLIGISKYKNIITVNNNWVNDCINPVIACKNPVNVSNNGINVNNNAVNVNSNPINADNNKDNVNINSNLENRKLSYMFDEFFENQ